MNYFYALILLTWVGCFTPTQAQDQFTVEGKVIDTATDEPLPGVNILAKGTTTGTVTDIDGNYRLTVANDVTTLVYSSIGYERLEEVVNGRNTINISLAPDIQSLSEIVVVGYGTQEKSDVTGAISSVSGEDIAKLPITGVQDALQGQTTGVVVTQNSGQPGSGVSVRIRGLGTLGDNDPLYVIDGVQTKDGLNLLNPNDIQSIEILKDASAAAIYGVRGANGVVLITTKKGELGAPKVNFSSYYGVQSLANKVDLLNARDWARLQQESLTNGGDPVNPDFDTEEKIAAAGEGTDWFDEIFRTAPIQNYQLSVSGGNESTNYYVSGSYFGQEGIILNSFYDRFSFRGNIESKVSDRLTIGSNLTLSRSEQNFLSSSDNDDDVIGNAATIPPIVPVYDENGDFAGPPEPQRYYGRSQNPVGQAYRQDDVTTNTRILGNVYGVFEIIEGLNFRTDLQIDYFNNDIDNFIPTFNEGNRTGPLNGLFRTINQTNYYSWENTLNYSFNLGQAHEFDVLAGVTAQNYAINSLFASRREFLSQVENNRFINGGTQDIANRGELNDWSLLSYLGRINYSLHDRYLLTASFRADGSSRFSEDNRWGYFPSFSAGWRISEEAFFDPDFVSNLKLRGGWGQLGNQDVGFYPTLTLYEINGNATYPFGGTNDGTSPGYSVVNRGDPSITWETSVQSNIGIEAGFLEDKITVSFDYYNRTTEDILVRRPVSSLGGTAPAPFVNAATVANTGIELLLGYRNAIGDFSYEINGNFTTYNNEVTSLGVGDDITTGRTRTTEGEPIGSFFGFATDGLFQNQSEIDAANAIDGEGSSPFQPGAAPGDIRFVDINEDGQIDDDDRTFIGNPTPDITYGLNANVAYKNFDVSLFLQGVAGNEIFNDARRTTERTTIGSSNGHATLLGRWTGEGTSNTIPRLTSENPNNNERVSDRFVEDGSYLRIKNLQFGYTLPIELLDRISISTARVYVSGQNLLTITDYSGFDPEIGRNTGNDLSAGIDTYSYPQPRTFLVGLNVTF